MTKWEQWLSEKSRKDIICSVVGHCGTGCILYEICNRGFETVEESDDAVESYLDSEAVPTRDAVIINLSVMKDDAEREGYGGYVKTLERAIELLKEG